MKNRIAEIRKEKKLSMQAFGDRIGISREAVRLIENGNSNPAERTIRDICKEFNINREWLVNGTGDKKVKATKYASLDALAKANNLDDLTRAVIITLIEMPQHQREAFQTLVSNAAEKMRSADQEGAQAMNLANALDIIEAAKAQGFEMDLDIRTE